MDAENAADPVTEIPISLVIFDTDHEKYFAGRCPHPGWVFGHVAPGTWIFCCSTSHRIERAIHAYVYADPATLLGPLLAPQSAPRQTPAIAP